MITPRIWVDADSCPKLVREYLLNYAKKLTLEIIFVANKIIPKTVEYSLFKMVVCPKESQSADNYIIENCAKGDIVITRDIPLAHILLQNEICVINDRGVSFTKENIKERLSERDFSLQIGRAHV